MRILLLCLPMVTRSQNGYGYYGNANHAWLFNLSFFHFVMIMKCIECSAKVTLSVSAFTRCRYCNQKELCMVHRLPEKHTCCYKESEKFKQEVSSFNDKLIKSRLGKDLIFE